MQRRCEWLLLVGLGISVIAGCNSLRLGEPFAPVGDLRTTTPRSNVERGFGEQVVAPQGLSWTLAVDGFHSTVRSPAPRYDFSVHLVDTLRAPGEEPRAVPDFATAELVDDSGKHFVCRRALVPDRAEAEPSTAEDSASGLYTLLFDLPTDYRFASVGGLSVHWQLHFEHGEVLPISSRFRR